MFLQIFILLHVVVGALIYLKFFKTTPAPNRLWYKPSTKDELPQYDEKQSVVWVTGPSETRPIRKAEVGMGAVPSVTVMELFKNAVEKRGADVAFKYQRTSVDDPWEQMSWADYYKNVMAVGRAFIELGLPRFGTVNIIGFNSPEWVMSNMGAIAAGAKAAGIYSTNTPEACQYISEHSEAQVIVVEDAGQLNKFRQIYKNLPNLKALVQYKGDPDTAGFGDSIKVLSWTELLELGEGASGEEQDKRLASQQVEEACTLIYTSGTTGPPKAVMISHDNATWTASSHTSMFPLMGQSSDGEHLVSYLPLSHIAAQLLDIYLPLVICANYPSNCTLWFAQPTALKGTLVNTLTASRPTAFFGVPRVWEKIAEKMKSKGKNNKGLKLKLINWAKSVGLTTFQNRAVGGNNQYAGGYAIAEGKIFAAVKKAIGLDRCALCFTGAAPISRETLNFFGALDITILELYGMSECTGPMTTCLPNYYKVGSCGIAIKGAELKIDHVAGRDKPGEGEICFRGRHIMMGYMNNKIKSTGAIDSTGFLHSGDVGRVDEDGFLFITGRIKELIITAGGENIAPVPIEDNVKDELPAISNVMMVGDQRKYNVCLITLRQEPDSKTGGFLDNLDGASKELSAKSTTWQQARDDPVWQEYITAGIKRANEKAVSRAAKIQKFKIVTDFSVPDNLLTPTLKLKRPTVNERYAEVIESLYA